MRSLTVKLEVSGEVMSVRLTVRLIHSQARGIRGGYECEAHRVILHVSVLRICHIYVM